MLKVVLCDDSLLEASQLENMLHSYQNISIETQLYTNPQKLLQQVSTDVHCIFLDVDMPDISGIEVAREIRKFNPFIPIIFVTSYRDYMEQVFEVQTFDYLVKPIQSDKIKQVLNRVIRYLDLGQSIFTFSFGKQSYAVPLGDIAFFEKDRRSVFIYTKDETYKSLLKTRELLTKLPSYFIQIHTSYIINPKYIKDYDSKTVTISIDGCNETILPISRKFQGTFKKHYHQYLSERSFS